MHAVAKRHLAATLTGAGLFARPACFPKAKPLQREAKWYFEVRGVNEQPTIFPITQKDSLSFQCENPDNEFPKIIRYALDGKQLKALISDGTMEIPFYFEPKEEN